MGPIRYRKVYNLYRCYDSAGDLLYVGISHTPNSRLESHRRSAPWGDLIARVTVEHVGTEGQAIVKEKAVIAEELPRYNIADNPRYKGLPESRVHPNKVKADLERELHEMRVKRGREAALRSKQVRMLCVSKASINGVMFVFDPPVSYPASTPPDVKKKLVDDRVAEIRAQKGMSPLAA